MLLCQPPEDRFRELVSKYGLAWERQDVLALCSIFTEDAIYQERAFERPLKGLVEIRRYWERKVAKEQSNIRFRILSLYGGIGTGVAEWEAEFDDIAQNVRKKIREVAILELSGEKIRGMREYWSSKRL